MRLGFLLLNCGIRIGFWRMIQCGRPLAEDGGWWVFIHAGLKDEHHFIPPSDKDTKDTTSDDA